MVIARLGIGSDLKFFFDGYGELCLCETLIEAVDKKICYFRLVIAGLSDLAIDAHWAF